MNAAMVLLASHWVMRPTRKGLCCAVRATGAAALGTLAYRRDSLIYVRVQRPTRLM